MAEHTPAKPPTPADTKPAAPAASAAGPDPAGKPDPPGRDWDRYSKIASTAQSVFVCVAGVVGGVWFVNEYFAEGKNVRGYDITVAAGQLAGNKGDGHLLKVDVDIKGSDRKGLRYNFERAHLDVYEVSFDPKGVAVPAAVAKLSPAQPHTDGKGQTGQVVNVAGTVAAYRTVSYTFLLKVPRPGVYLVSFVMPHAGLVDYRGPDPPEYDHKDPKITGTFAGEQKSVYVTVRD